MAPHREMGNKVQRYASEERSSCCTWPKIIVLVIAVVITGIVIWKFAPIDDALDNVLPNFNSTDAAEPVDDGDETNVFTSPTPTPVSSKPSFQFMKCGSEGQKCCNGLDTICDLGVDEILYASVHNAMSTFEDGFLFSANHRYPLEGALEAGYRGLNLDVCNCGGVLQHCHGACNLGSRDVEATMSAINRFLERNPSEVLLITLQIDSGVDEEVNINQLYNQMDTVAGESKFTDKFYVHADPDAKWPTLGEVIQAGKRVLMFHFNGPTCKEVSCPAGLHYWFDYAVETEFSFGTVSDVAATSTSCNVTRGSTRDTFFAVNNFVTPPDHSMSETLNAYNFAKNRIASCSQNYNGLDVNLIYADFWFAGDLPQVTQEHNAALAQARRQKRRQLRMPG